MKQWLGDFLERLGWTIVESAAAFALTYFADWDYSWIPILVVLLTAVKGIAAKKVGNNETAAIGGPHG